MAQRRREYRGTKRWARKLEAGGAGADPEIRAEELAAESTGAGSAEAEEYLRHDPVAGADEAALNDMLGRAEEIGAAPKDDAAPSAQLVIDAAAYPGLAMGITGIMTVGLVRLRMAALTDHEASALTAAILENLNAWDLSLFITDPRWRAGLNLGGALVGIMVPRIISDIRRMTASPTQHAAEERAADAIPPAS